MVAEDANKFSGNVIVFEVRARGIMRSISWWLGFGISSGLIKMCRARASWLLLFFRLPPSLFLRYYFGRHSPRDKYEMVGYLKIPRGLD